MSCAAGGRGHQSGPRSSLIAAAMAIWPAESALEPSALAEGAPPAGARRTRPAAETPLKPLAAVTGPRIPGGALRGTRGDWDEGGGSAPGPAPEPPLKPLAAVTGPGIPVGALRGTRGDWDEWVVSPPGTGALGELTCPVLPRGTAVPGGGPRMGATPAARLGVGMGVMMPQPQQREETRPTSGHLARGRPVSWRHAEVQCRRQPSTERRGHRPSAQPSG